MAHEITGLHHIQLAMPPGEEDAGRRFYGELLGLAEVPKPSELAGDPFGNRIELLEPA